MPIYDYRCEACGASHEAIQKSTDAPLTDCPACGAPKLRKQLSAPAFRLKGGGWYETDFKTGNKKNLAGDSGADKQCSSSAEKKSSAGDTGSASKSSSSSSTAA